MLELEFSSGRKSDKSPPMKPHAEANCNAMAEVSELYVKAIVVSENK
jgi:hypothetical protein